MPAPWRVFDEANRPDLVDPKEGECEIFPGFRGRSERQETAGSSLGPDERGSEARLDVRYHAEGGTLDEATFESAARPLQQEVHTKEVETESLLDTLPGGRWEADQQAIQRIASDVLHRLDSLGFDEKQRLIALLDVQSI